MRNIWDHLDMKCKRMYCLKRASTLTAVRGVLYERLDRGNSN